MFEIITIQELLKRLDNYNHKELHVHHTWKPVKRQYTGSNGLQLQNSMRETHIKVNGWTDIGQHVTLLPDGLFVTGRDFGKTPASISGFNTGAFACEMLGNFDTKDNGEFNSLGYDKFEGAQKESMMILARHFYLKKKYIRFHNENSDKSCPGTSINKSAFIGEVKAIGKVAAPTVTYNGKEYIRKLQELCNEAGLKGNNCKSLTVDGLWGTNTEHAAPILFKGCSVSFKWFIKLVQDILLVKGYKLPKYGPDGDYGLETLSAITEFQKDNYLVPDGIIGKITWAKLLN